MATEDEQRTGDTMGTVVKKVMLVGRATTLVVGLAVILALTVGAGTTALAAVPGDPFRVGQLNVVDAAVTRLVGANDGPMMVVDNNSAAANARALDLRVEAGRAPMRVDSDVKVANLNADQIDGKDSGDFAPRVVEAWHEVGTQGEPPFSGVPSIGYGWANFDQAHNTVGFYKDPYGVVHLKGVVKWTNDSGFNSYCGSYGDIFTLPAGYRPPVEETQPSMKNDTFSRMNIETDGEVTICDSRSTVKGDWYSLDGITFRAAQ